MSNSDLQQIGDSSAPSRTDEAVAALERRLQQEIHDRTEERFYFLLFIIIVFNVFAFSHIQHWIGMSIIFILEIVFIIASARFFGVDQLIVPLERLFNIALSPLDRKPKK
jgi:hypothetical protein